MSGWSFYAAHLDDSGTNEEPLAAELRIAHAPGVLLEVAGLHTELVRHFQTSNLV